VGSFFDGESSMEKRSWIKMSLPVTPEMHKTISEAARKEGQTNASFIRGKLNQFLNRNSEPVRFTVEKGRD